MGCSTVFGIDVVVRFLFEPASGAGDWMRGAGDRDEVSGLTSAPAEGPSGVAADGKGAGSK